MTLPQTESFRPLTTAPTSAERREFRATVIHQGTHSGAFQSLETSGLSGPGVIPIAAKTCEPRVAVQRDGDRVISIHIQCTCGQVTDLACVYEEQPKHP